MNAIVVVAALAASAAGVVALAIGSAVARRPRLALGMCLDLWLAAGALGLSARTSWRHLGAVAAILVVRKLVAAQIAVVTRGRGHGRRP